MKQYDVTVSYEMTAADNDVGHLRYFYCDKPGAVFAWWRPWSTDHAMPIHSVCLCDLSGPPPAIAMPNVRARVTYPERL